MAKLIRHNSYNFVYYQKNPLVQKSRNTTDGGLPWVESLQTRVARHMYGFSFRALKCLVTST